MSNQVNGTIQRIRYTLKQLQNIPLFLEDSNLFASFPKYALIYSLNTNSS